MNTRTKTSLSAALFALAAAGLLSQSGTAQAAGSGLTPGPWQYSATIYGYLPDIDATTTFPDGSGSGIGVNAKTIIDHLKMTFMGSLGAHNGQWGVFTDLLYMDVGASKSGVGLGEVLKADLSYDMKAWIWTLGGQYRIAARPNYTMDVIAGARMFEIKQRLDWTPYVAGIPLGESRRSNVDDRVWDGIVGAKGRYAFGQNLAWSIPYYLDVGAGQSRLTWQAAIGITYGFKWGELGAMWRYLDYDFKSGGSVQDMSLSGPMVGGTVRW